jgi:D-alanyl-D-alanine carboxypeptidase/D-alanyl-D-alanine-endopeptidase (penicillin-binding protein 4)
MILPKFHEERRHRDLKASQLIHDFLGGRSFSSDIQRRKNIGLQPLRSLPLCLRQIYEIAACLFLVLAALLSFALPTFAQTPSIGANTGKSSSAAPRAKSRPDVARFRARVDGILAQAHAQHAFWGVLVTDRDTGETLYELNAAKLFTPASNRKVFTTIFALAALGPGHHYSTFLASSVPLGADGHVAGDLIFKGSGDPDLSNRKFPFAGKAEREGPIDKVLIEMADAAVAKGLKVVDGDIVADDSLFPYDPYPAGWEIGDLFFTYGAPVSAIAFNEDAISVEVRPGEEVGDPAVLTVQPAAAAGTFREEIVTGAAGGKPEFSVLRRPGLDFILLRGSIPRGHSPAKLDLPMTDPAETTAEALKLILESRGVRLTGSTRVQHAPPPERHPSGEVSLVPRAVPNPPVPALTLAEHTSPSLLESVRLTNKISQNLHTELFLRTVASEKIGVGSSDVGLKLEQDFLKTVGIADGDVILTDGSGAAGNNLITPRSIVQILQYAARQPWGADFASTLPTAGVDGSLEFRMQGTHAFGRIQAKTGTHSHHHTLAGYATTLAGERLVFAIFCNNTAERGHDATGPMDEIAVAMVETIGNRPAHKQKK